MALDEESKKQAIAEIVQGQVIDDSNRVAVCIKGSMNGFPVAFEAMNTGWPFGVNYTIETGASSNPHQNQNMAGDCKITVYPRMGRGLMGIVTKILLFESNGMPIGDGRLEKTFNFSYDDRDMTERFTRYPGVVEHLMGLEETTKFSEMVIRTQVGIFLSQPVSFSALDVDVCRATFRHIGELGQVLFEAFMSDN